MTTKRQPATPLPWTGSDQSARRGAVEIHANGHIVASFRKPQDMRFADHAANAYPKLVEALRNCIDADLESNVDAAEALLRELGEE